MDGSATGARLSPRLTVLGVLMATFVWALVIPMSLAEPPSTQVTALFAVGLAALGAALVAVLWVAVRPASSTRMKLWCVGLLVTVSLVLWMPSYSWAAPGEEPWAWLAGFVIAASALVTWRAGVASGLLLCMAAAIGGVVFSGSVVANLLTVLGSAAVAWGVSQVLVWLLRLLWAAQAGRQAEAELFIAEERLRVSRELHDVLGHRLGTIALKAELAADLATRDPVRSAAESDAIRVLASETLAEARRAVHGDTVAGLETQLNAADLVLASAGIVTTIDTDGSVARLPKSTSNLLAVVVREAVTNILRHSDARQVSIRHTETDSSIRLAIVNDGLREPESAPGGRTGGKGLASLSARCSAAGARLVAGQEAEGRFALRVEFALARTETA